MARLELRLLGPLQVTLDQQPITTFESNKVRALLAYLAVEARQPHPRESLAGLLWPDWPNTSALSNLRYALADLRKNTGDRGAQPPFLSISRDSIQFNPASHAWVDVSAFAEQTSHLDGTGLAPGKIEELNAAIALYRGPFLDGFSLNDSPPFEQWVLQQREQLHRRILQALATLSEHYAREKDYAQALYFAWRQVELEPWKEESHQLAMRLLALSGQRSAALVQFEKCRQLLETELGVKPGAATVELYEQIRDGKLTSPQPVLTPVSVENPPPSIPRKEQGFDNATLLRAPKNNLPVQLTSFVGRQKEISELNQLLQKPETRLVTLTGAGGTGKTRLALQVAAGLKDYFSDGVWLVELASLVDPDLVPQTVMAALRILEKPGKTPIAILEDFFQYKRLLLILDNCEHLVDASAELAAGLLPCAPGLTILSTSREILGVAGEIPLRIPPLSVPDLQHLPSIDDLATYEAMRLFVERARVVSPQFELTQENAASVAQITRRLDGIPLAIELAAARLRLLSVEQIALRLNDAFRLLTGGARTALPRHQTLQALIDWSYNLLSEKERSLLRSLSVFAGGWTLDAAEEIGGESNIVLDLLGALADKSLILAVQLAGGEIRYRMLETVRQYAHSRMVDAGEAAAVHQRHLEYYLRQVEALEPKLRSREQITTLDYLETELDNLRLALEWALQTVVEAELRLAASLMWFWHIRYHWDEAIAWLQQGLAAEAHSRGSQPLAGSRLVARAKALTALGFHITLRGWPAAEKAMPILEEALILYQTSRAENRRGLAWALLWLGGGKFYLGERVESQVMVDEALGLFREAGDSHGMAECFQVLGEFEIDRNRQKEFYLEQLAVDEANGDVEGIATALFHIGTCYIEIGDYTSCFAALESSLENYQRVGNSTMVALTKAVIAFAAQFNGNMDYAILAQDEALATYRELGNDNQIADCLFWKGMQALAQGQYDEVTRFTEEAGLIIQKTGNLEALANIIYLRIRLARLRGEVAEAHRFAQEGLTARAGLGHTIMWLLLESGFLALQDGHLAQASAFLREGLQALIQRDQLHFIAFLLDGLALLAARQGKLERAARLFGTRLWRGAAHTLSPIERDEREDDFAKLKAALGEERFIQLQAEGSAMTFEQILALAQEENG